MTKVSKRDAERIRQDARIAEDMMQRIQKETTEKQFVGAYYILEKAEKARDCIEFIIAAIRETIEQEETE